MLGSWLVGSGGEIRTSAQPARLGISFENLGPYFFFFFYVATVIPCIPAGPKSCLVKKMA